MSRPQPAAGRVAVGTAGWSYPDWRGRVYGRTGRSGLELLATIFDLAEVNSTFYRIPEPAVARRWLRSVSNNPHFVFAVKAWSGFTHERNWGDSDLRAFVAAVEPLRAHQRLAAVLLQFPWSFKRSEATRCELARLLDAFAGLPLAVEFRHASWDRPAVLRSLRERGAAFVNIDQPLFPHSLAATEHATAPVAYVRLHGRNQAAWFREDAGRDQRYDYCYTLAELEVWTARIRSLARRAREVLVVTNNHFQGQAVVNAVELRALLENEAPVVPSEWLRVFPRLASRCRPGSTSQGELFN